MENNETRVLDTALLSSATAPLAALMADDKREVAPEQARLIVDVPFSSPDTETLADVFGHVYR
jgi:hypothetical protein